MRGPPPAGRVHRRAVALLGLCLVAAELSLVVGSAAGATDVVTLPASADTYLRSGAPDTNEGGSTFLRLRASGENRALVRLDQTALVQAVGSGTLVSASLELEITDNGNNWGSSGRTISAFRLTSDWAEGNGVVDRGSPPDRGTGSGSTWACAVDSDISDQGKDCAAQTDWEMGKPSQPELHPWAEPASATMLITNGLGGTISFDVSADVQAFLSGSATNHGWIVKKDLEGPSGLFEFASRETGAGPRLVLTLDQASGPPVNTSPPVVSGTPADEQVLSVSTGSWGGAPATFAYQWQRCSPYSVGVTSDGPIGWWRMTESSGSEMRDISGYENHGTYPSGVTLRGAGAPAGLAGGDDDRSVSLAGSGGVAVPASETLDGLSGELSMEVWLRPGVNATSVPIVGREVGDGSVAGDLPAFLYGLVLDAGGTISMRLRLVENGSSGADEPLLDEVPPDVVRDVSLTAPLVAGANGWSHVVAVYDGEAMSILVNGQLAASQPAVGSVPLAPERPLTVGALQSGSNAYVGDIDELALYGHALDLARVQAHFGLAGQGCTDIVAATESSYAVSVDDAGSQLRARVTASNGFGSQWALSLNTPLVTARLAQPDGPFVEPPFVEGMIVEPPDPPAPSQLSARSTTPTSTFVAEQGVTVSESPDSFKFRNQDGVWSIAKRCTQSVDGRTSTGPGYVFRLTSPLGVTYVNDALPAQTPTPLDPQFPFGAMNQVFGGLGSFGFHYARGRQNNSWPATIRSRPARRPISRVATRR